MRFHFKKDKIVIEKIKRYFTYIEPKGFNENDDFVFKYKFSLLFPLREKFLTWRIGKSIKDELKNTPLDDVHGRNILTQDLIDLDSRYLCELEEIYKSLKQK